jgi:hypothetical protein
MLDGELFPLTSRISTEDEENAPPPCFIPFIPPEDDRDVLEDARVVDMTIISG